MKFVIRDDDVNFFSTPSDIEALYGDIFAQNIPVGFSAIPFVGEKADVYPWQFPGVKKEYPIGENAALVEYMKQHELIEILQHGCTHETIEGIFEYQKITGLYEDTSRGKLHLEETFARPITVFVAPHDQFSNHAIDSIERTGLNIIRSKGSKNIITRFDYVSVIIKMLLHKIRFAFISIYSAPAYPFTVSFKRHAEAFSQRIEEGYDSLRFGMEHAKSQNGNFVVVTHLHMMSENTKITLYKLLSTAEEMGFTFARPSELFINEK